MAAVEDDDSPPAAAGTAAALRHRFGIDRLALAVAGVAAFALAIRLVALGDRVAHWDEARVGWWILEYVRTGTYEYRPILHGPFYHHLNKYVFGLVGPSDASMRLAAAVSGGLAPLSALALRRRLGDAEVVGLALFLAANPVLLYYSRFMRGDPLVGVFGFGAFVLFVLAIDSGLARHLFAGTALLALAFTAKENALLYPVTWAGALVLLLDHRLFRAADRGREWTALLRRHASRTAAAVWAWLHWLLFALVEFLLVIVLFYAPRSADPDALSLGNALRDPTMLPALIDAATVGTWQAFYGLWVSGGHQDHAYLPFLGHYLETMGYGALALSVLAVVGFVADRYAEDGPRDVVSFGFYWGFVSVLGYPIVTDIQAPWATIHAIVPLAIPAAVGLALVYRWGRESLAADDRVGVGIAAAVLLLVAAQVAGAGLWAVVLAPQSDGNQLVQYAQPSGDLRPTLDRMAAASADDGGTDVLLYGEYFVDGDANATREPACAKWFNSLPLPWYWSVQDSEVACTQNADELRQRLEDPPPVVITRATNERTVGQHVPGYHAETHMLRSFDTEAVFFVHPDYVGDPRAAERVTDSAE